MRNHDRTESHIAQNIVVPLIRITIILKFIEESLLIEPRNYVTVCGSASTAMLTSEHNISVQALFLTLRASKKAFVLVIAIDSDYVW